VNAPETGTPKPYSFGRWRFNAATGDLFDGEAVTRLEPQVAKLLVHFLANQNTLISRDELMATVWDNRIVSDDAINRCVSILRQTLSPDEKNAFIETVVRKGFISHFPSAPYIETRTARPMRLKVILASLALVGLALLVLYTATRTAPDSTLETVNAPSEKIPKLAVLPFSTSEMMGDSEFFANGMHDDLLTQLAHLESLRVISRTSVLEYRDTRRNLREIARELNADAILEGGIQRIGDQIRINVQLIDARNDVHLWAQQYDRQLLPANIFKIQSEITHAIVAALRTTLTEQDAEQLRVLPTENMAAYRAYHRALDIRDTAFIGAPGYIEALEEAVALDPGFVRAWAELAGLLSFENFNQQDPASVQRVEQILEKIHELAPRSAEYLIAQAYFTYYILKDYERAYEFVNQAQQLTPSDVRVIELKSWIQRRLGDFPGTIDSRRLIHELDPRNPRWVIALAASLILNHQYQETEEFIKDSTIQTSWLSVMLSMLKVRNNGDLSSWLESLTATQNEFDEMVNPLTWWDAYIANRDYAGAESVLEGINQLSREEMALSFRPLEFEQALSTLITYWLLQDSERLNAVVDRLSSRLAETEPSDQLLSENDYDLLEAFAAAAEGDTDKTERLIRAWFRAVAGDFAEFWSYRHYACRALGMAAATAAAVDCLRSSLVEPSYVMPFIEPYLPYYDAIRDQPEFVDFLLETQGTTSG